MKHIKTYENLFTSNKHMKLLLEYLKNKNLNIDFKIWPSAIIGNTRLAINGDDFTIFTDFNKDLKPAFAVNYMRDVKIQHGRRAGNWDRKYFDFDQFDEIYEFVKDIFDNNNLKMNTKKYNL